MSAHTFDADIAMRVGIPAAVIYKNLCFWIAKNEANGSNFKDGRYWTYNSIAAFAKLFPYLTEKQIRTALDKLLTEGLIVKAHHSDKKHDRTTWYALGDPICPRGQVDVPSGADHASAPEGKSYRNRYNPDKKPDDAAPCGAAEAAAEDKNLELLWASYPEDRRRSRAECSALLAAALREASIGDLVAAARAYRDETQEHSRSRVCYLDNWLRSARWRGHVAEARKAQGQQASALEEVAQRSARWIKMRAPTCRHLSPIHVTAALERGLITKDDVRAAGLSPPGPAGR